MDADENLEEDLTANGVFADMKALGNKIDADL